MHIHEHAQIATTKYFYLLIFSSDPQRKKLLCTTASHYELVPQMEWYTSCKWAFPFYVQKRREGHGRKALNCRGFCYCHQERKEFFKMSIRKYNLLLFTGASRRHYSSDTVLLLICTLKDCKMNGILGSYNIYMRYFQLPFNYIMYKHRVLCM